ncbi:O-antigen ligase family protein [Halopseudomonas laoshanensis]|uniref:O-antigen ligase family protein n=1 Tax=Halopseudomonas laoshanensis TaxID=2268758 RepID=A0A7V7KVV2_9GAMM|nr:O-antigen ligase family protein [Halopseudomonas laoshanensis]KAA0695340.1 O-antigen ligase family protein [Halopseudomonas laoshanensis]
MWAGLLLLVFIFFAFSAVVAWHPDFNWHDQQRVLQLLLLVIAATGLFFLHPIALPPFVFLLVLAIFTLGLFSVLSSEWPSWAWKEWGRYLGLVILALVLGRAAKKAWIVKLVLGTMVCIGSLHAFQFMVYYTAAFISGIYMLDSNILFNGFSNPRFFAQFQVLLMPILAWLAWYLKPRNLALSILFLAILMTQWCMTFALGGRGLWFGLLVSSIMLLLCSPRYWRLIMVQAAAGLAGFAIFVLLFYLIPTWLDILPERLSNLRTSLSGRDLIWFWAWEMVQDNPWLGVGPMHYSAVYNPIAAHPHQVLLQWAAEWGLPAAIMTLVLALWGTVFGMKELRQGPINFMHASVWLSICGALILAQVDGVFVMPYIETWLAILVGLALAFWVRPIDAPKLQLTFFRIMAIPVLIILGSVLVYEVPTVPQASDRYMREHNTSLLPRFWAQGWVPMDRAD